MYGNGATTGKEITVVTHRQILKDLIVGLTACAVAVAGSTSPGTVARRIVSTSTRRTATTTLACGWPFEVTTALPLCGRNSFYLT